MTVAEDHARLEVVGRDQRDADPDDVATALRHDSVALVEKVDPERADRLVLDVAERFGLGDSLRIQAGFASLFGHRSNVGEHFMTVNTRPNYGLIRPHCEGSSFVGLQLAAFYCYENTTDGGETLLFNVDESSPILRSHREHARRGRVGPSGLSPQLVTRARALYQVSPPFGLHDDDVLVREMDAPSIDGLTLIDVLTGLKPAFSTILNRTVYAYWDSVSGSDTDCGKQFEALLRSEGLLKEPDTQQLTNDQLDFSPHRPIWTSGARLSDLFRCRVTRKLRSGDLVFLNNMTWAHATANWTPGNGVRNVVAAFA